ncbi:hypothetical protein R5W23_004377 [Gemmata sp. JC673]|uniref:Cyclic-phosphate processing Receiver domain-containing protein n=1 Tax=Gemmata algarum TaxID=2975278 RepID=A0ABU5F5N0_9BACT|nr:cyclic-phosphate processing receiver domain-containing protein [Gemmata algarum]MDY3562896.1 hypothetical protein [Gemmata algarum]
MPIALMLEDEAERLVRFRAVAARLGCELVCWPNAHRMIAEMGERLAEAAFISLDHDLEPEDATDPGDGLDVAKHLAGLSPTCPVIVHTSNSARGDSMMGEFELAGWRRHRVLPIGDDWIEVDWAWHARNLLRRAKRVRRTTDKPSALPGD